MNETIKNLLKDESKALRALHKVFNIDFCAPFQAFTIKGNTTIKQILKKVENNDSIILVLSKGGFLFPNAYRVARLYPISETVEIEFKKKIYSTDAQNLRTYYAKKDFHADLKIKNEGYKHIVIVQEKKYLTPEKEEKKLDLSSRYKYIDCSFCGYSNRPGKFINKLTLLLTDSKGEKVTYTPSYYYGKEYTEESQIIDKSGYILVNKRMHMKDAAEEIRKSNKKADFMTFDCSPYLEEIKTIIDYKKNALVDLLRNASSPSDFYRVGRAVGDSYHDNLERALKLFEEIQKGATDRTYSSIESFKNDCNRCHKILNNLLKGE